MTMVVGGDKISNQELPNSQTTPDWFSELVKNPVKFPKPGESNLHYVSIENGENQATPRNASASYYSFLTNPVQPGYPPHRVDALTERTDYSLTATLKRAQTKTA
jgi:hypothetical protein